MGLDFELNTTKEKKLTSSCAIPTYSVNASLQAQPVYVWKRAEDLHRNHLWSIAGIARRWHGLSIAPLHASTNRQLCVQLIISGAHFRFWPCVRVRARVTVCELWLNYLAVPILTRLKTL